MWEIGVGNQTVTFLYSLILGVILCVFYDFIRALRKAGFDSFWAVFLTDIVFWVFSAFAVFIFLISRTNGEIRGYVLFSAVAGFWLFRISFSKFLFPLLSLLFKTTLKLRSKTICFLDVIYSKINKIISLICSYTLKKLKLATKSIKKLLKNRSKVLYTNINNTDAENVLNETKT